MNKKEPEQKTETDRGILRATTVSPRHKKVHKKIEYKSYSFVERILKRLRVKNEAKRRLWGGRISISLAVLALTAWVYVGMMGATAMVTAFVMATKRLLPYGDLSQTLLETVLSAVVYVLAAVIVVFVPWVVSRKYLRTTRNEIGLRGSFTWADIGLAILAYVVSAFAGVMLLLVGQLLFNNLGIDWMQKQEVGFHDVYLAKDMILAYITLAVIAPVFEELIFRGWLYGKLRARIPALPAMLVVSLLFAAVHGQVNVGVVVFAMSVANCLLRELTGTIYSGVLVHILRNSVAFYGLFVMGF